MTQCFSNLFVLGNNVLQHSGRLTVGYEPDQVDFVDLEENLY